MSGPNGRPNGGVTTPVVEEEASTSPGFATNSDASGRLRVDEIRRYTTELEIPFDPDVIEWRVTNTRQDKTRGQVIPYADQRAYTDRLNALFTPAGWTRRYTIHTSANFQRGKDQKFVVKVLVACELTIFGLGSHSATGEEWADDDNAGTSAEAQAFKRSCSCFGLGRYLYYFQGVWVDLDDRKQPKRVPQLPKWATPQGWAEGVRPNAAIQDFAKSGAKAGAGNSQTGSLVSEIEDMATQLGRGLYRGLLRELARVWSPREIHDIRVQQKVLEHMRSAERGLRRLETALEKTGHEALVPALEAMGLTSVERVDNLGTLKRIVLELERVADGKP
jgi:hypothetical protein